ncbi:MAG: SpoIID/LytB domain-containing protein, partial [Bacteroidota bacterium]
MSCEKGNLKIIGDKSDTLTLNAGNSLTILKTNDSIELKSNEKSFGKFVWVRFYNQTQENLLSIKSINPDRKKRFYEDHLIVAIDKTNSCLRLINLLEMDKYIGGVVEAESGKRSHPEFYKTQAILARTYALSIIGRHIAEGHDLCDQVHCQAFYGRTKEPDIINGVISTREYVVVDREYNLINAVFHSNSGGQTANVEDVWGNPNSYLKSVRDSFSINMPNYQWTRKMSVEDWLEYLKIKHKVPFEDSSSRLSALNFNQPKRKSHLEINGRKIPLKIIRTDLN